MSNRNDLSMQKCRCSISIYCVYLLLRHARNSRHIMLSELPSLMTVVKVIYVLGELGQCYLILTRVRLTENMTVFFAFFVRFYICVNEVNY